MRPGFFTGIFFAASLCLPLAGTAQSAFAQSGLSHLTAAQTISPTDMTQKELGYYRTLDAAAAKNFIVTRSYVRLCQQVLDHKLPPLKLNPEKPEGFSVQYLLPDDPSVINKALGEYLNAKLKANPGALDKLGRAASGTTPSK